MLVGDRARIGLAAMALDSDHVRFTAAANSNDADEMVSWYRGAYCDQLELRAAPRFERWVDAERERLRRLLVSVVERQVAVRSAAGDLKGAARIASAVHAVEPTIAAAVELCADALVANGDSSAARRVLEDFRAHLRSTGESVPANIETKVKRIARDSAERPVITESRPPSISLSRSFVGRDAVLALLFQQMEIARGGQVARLVIIGPPGIGKSRVLDEFDARIRLRGTRLARVRFLPAMRGIPGSALAEFARALCALPGAMGVSERTAAVLVALLPELRTQFPSTPPLEVPTAELPRVRAEALVDLVAAVSEERLTLLLRDDDQNVDEVSRAVFEHALRREDLRLLDVRTSRVALSDDRSGSTQVELAPLSGVEVRSLLESAGPLPAESWVDDALRDLTARSAGIPQLLLQRLRALENRGALALDGAGWRSDDLAELAGPGESASELADLVGTLGPSARAALQLLAQWRRPMREQDALAVLNALGTAEESGGWRAALGELEVRGLIAVRDDGWTVAHDTIAEACLSAQSRAEAEQLQHLFIRHWAGAGRLTVPVLEHLSLLCGTRDLRGAAVSLVRAASRDAAVRGFGLGGRLLAQRVATAAGQPTWEGELYVAISWMRRRSRGTLVGLGSLAGIVASGLIWLGWMLWPRLVVESEPMTENALGGGGGGVFVIQPRVAVYNGFGRRLAGYRGLVRVRTPDLSIAGDTVIPFEDGRAQYERLSFARISRDAPIDSVAAVLEFDATGLARGTRIGVRGSAGFTDVFRVVHLSMNGLPVDRSFKVRARLGDTLRFALTFEYTTTLATSNYVVGATPLWMPRERATVRLAGLPRPVRNAWQSVYFTVPPAERAGRSFVVILTKPDDSVEHLFSMTNWAVGAPIWNDGNDVHDLPIERLHELRERGETTGRALDRGYQGRQRDSYFGELRIVEGTPDSTRFHDTLLRGAAVEVNFYAPGDSIRKPE